MYDTPGEGVEGIKDEGFHDIHPSASESAAF
jgi:hypothetical protein